MGNSEFTLYLYFLTAKIFQKYLQKDFKAFHSRKWGHAQKLLGSGVWEEGEPRFHQHITEKDLLPYGAAYQNQTQHSLQKWRSSSDVSNMSCRLVGPKYILSSKDTGSSWTASFA